PDRTAAGAARSCALGLLPEGDDRGGGVVLAPDEEAVDQLDAGVESFPDRPDGLGPAGPGTDPALDLEGVAPDVHQVHGLGVGADHLGQGLSDVGGQLGRVGLSLGAPEGAERPADRPVPFAGEELADQKAHRDADSEADQAGRNGAVLALWAYASILHAVKLTASRTL